MRPEESARVARRVAFAIKASPCPDAAMVASDLSDLLAAVNGDPGAARRLASRLPSGMSEMAQLERAFRAAGEEPPEMRLTSRGRWLGSFSGVKIAVHAAPGGDIQKILVAGRPVRDWNEVMEAARYHSAMADNGTPEDPEDLEAAAKALGANAFHCVKCDGPVSLDADYDCKKCGTEYVSCPGCDLPYPMDANEDDHCPMCGHSSWAELPEEVSAAWTAALMDAAKKAAETRQPQQAAYKDFTVTVTVEGDGDQMNLVVTAPDGEQEDDGLESWMEQPSPLLSRAIDEHIWSGPSMKAPEPYKGPAAGVGGDLEQDGSSVQVQGSGKTPYILMHKGDIFSCSCPAWKIQKLPANKRTCKHLKQVRGADVEAARVGG